MQHPASIDANISEDSPIMAKACPVICVELKYALWCDGLAVLVDFDLDHIQRARSSSLILQRARVVLRSTKMC